VFNRALVSILVLSTSVALGCVEAEPEGVTSVELPVTAPGPDGSYYQLSHADFQLAQLDGPNNVVAHSDNNTEATVVELVPGHYSVTLLPGWQMLQVAADGTITAVDAVLASDNPQYFNAWPDFTRPVVFEFLIANPNGQVSISMGTSDGRATRLGLSFENRIVLSGDPEFLAGYGGGGAAFGLVHGIRGEELQPDGALAVTIGPIAVTPLNATFGALDVAVADALQGADSQYIVRTRNNDGNLYVLWNFEGWGGSYHVRLAVDEFNNGPGALAPDGTPIAPNRQFGESRFTLDVENYSGDSAQITGSMWMSDTP
jgi:hypothetical protein